MKPWATSHVRRDGRITAAVIAALLTLTTLTGVAVHPRVERAGATEDRGSVTQWPLLDGTVSPRTLAQPLTWQVLQGASADGGVNLDSAVASARADQVWDETTGGGSVIALIDTGVEPVPALDGAIAGEIDFTGSGGGDGYGHGTFMASVIAGRGDVAPGVAPGAGVLSLKVADAEGGTDLGTVLGALEWLAGPGRALGIKVAVLALSVDADTAAGQILDLATQRLANLGVLVVASSGNSGPGTLAAPASSPATVSVGSVDDQGTATQRDDVVADFSADGPDRLGVPQPDVLASGVRVVGAIGADSLIARENPQALIGEHLFRGSGTSMSAALAGGVAALVADVRPDLRGADLATSLTSTDALDAVSAVATAKSLPEVDSTMIAPAAGRAFGDAVSDLAAQRVENLAIVEQQRVTDRAAAEERYGRRANQAQKVTPDVLKAQLAGIDEAAAVNARAVSKKAEARIDELEAQLLGGAVQAPTTEGWAPAVWADTHWVAADWAAERWAAHDWSQVSDDALSWDSILLGAYGIPLIYWDVADWNAQRWDAQRWDAVQWGAQRWDAQRWDAIQWGAQRWDAQRWDAQRWDAVQWGAQRWDAQRWDAQRWDAQRWDAQRWDAVQWGAQRWDAVQWGMLPQLHGQE